MKLLQLFFFSFFIVQCFGQLSGEELRGGNGEGRDWWNLEHYDLSVNFDITNKQISGKNIITFRTTKEVVNPVFQIDLQEPMLLDSLVVIEKEMVVKQLIPSEFRKQNTYLIPLNDCIFKETSQYRVIAFFHGSPRVAKNAPWDGGIIWKKDENKKDWVSIACQGLGASVWFPCKDTQSDEPEQGVETHFTCPSDLVCVSNGRLTSTEKNEGNTTTYSWKVVNPINNYCIIPYIGDYVSWKDPFQGEKGELDVEYWVLRSNEEKAREQFKDVHLTLKAFEYWFGPYPFYEDGYKLVESPYLGMEHQSAVAYGNKYKKGYLGSDLSGSGQGLWWDYIIVHETGHEWFGNNITTADIADMWVHEGFTTYSETLFVEYYKGAKAGATYCRGERRSIVNDKPIIGPYGVNEEGSGDMYYKGANLIHTIRTIVNNDTLFREMLREMNQTFYHQIVTTQQIENFMSQKLNLDLSLIFDQYLRQTNPPTLSIKEKGNRVLYRWEKCIPNFEMPLVTDKGQFNITTEWTELPAEIGLSNNQYYFKSVQQKGKKKRRKK